MNKHLHNLGFVVGQSGIQAILEVRQVIYLLGLWSLTVEFIAQFRIRITYACARTLLRRKKFGHWTKGYCLLTHETKNSPTWKLKYKKHLQLECPLPIHIKRRSLVWAKDTLNLLFLGKQSTWQQHNSHPGKPPQQQNHTKGNAGLNCLVEDDFSVTSLFQII